MLNWRRLDRVVKEIEAEHRQHGAYLIQEIRHVGEIRLRQCPIFMRSAVSNNATPCACGNRN